MESLIKIRRAKPEDIEQLHRLDLECFSDPWSYEAREHDLCNVKWAIYHVAEVIQTDKEGKNVNGAADSRKTKKLQNKRAPEIAGYTAVWQIMDQVDINDVAVSPKFRRQHIGSRLLETMMQETRENGANAWTLEVRAGNTAAIGLYERFGFRSEATRKGYYQDNGEDALLMWARD